MGASCGYSVPRVGFRCLLVGVILPTLLAWGNARDSLSITAMPAEVAVWDPVHVSGTWGSSAWLELWREFPDGKGRFELVTEWGRPEANALGANVISVIRCTAGTLSPDCSVTLTGAQRMNSTVTVLRLSSDSAMPPVGTPGELGELIRWSGNGWGRIVGGSWKSPSELAIFNDEEEQLGSSQEVHLQFASAASRQDWPAALRQQVERFADPIGAARAQSSHHDRWVRLVIPGLYRWQLCVYAHELRRAEPTEDVRVPTNSSCHPVHSAFATVGVEEGDTKRDRDPTSDTVIGVGARDQSPSLRDIAAAWSSFSSITTTPSTASHIPKSGATVPPPFLAFRGPLGLGERGWRVPASALSDSLQTGRNGTLCTWLWIADGPTGTFRTLFHKGSGKTPHRTPSAWLDKNSMRVAMRVSSTTNWDVGGESVSALPLREWTHVCLRWANLSQSSSPEAKEPTYEMALFLNGALDTLLTVRGMVVLSNDGPIVGGKDPSYPGPRALWIGTRLFSESISASAIQSLFESMQPVFPSARPHSVTRGGRSQAENAGPAGFSRGEARLARALQLVVHTWQTKGLSAIPSITAAGGAGGGWNPQDAYGSDTSPPGAVTVPRMMREQVEDMVSRANSLWDDCNVEARVAMDLWEDACFSSPHTSGEACRRAGLAWLQPGRDMCKGDVARVTQLRHMLCPASSSRNRPRDGSAAQPCERRPGISRDTHWARKLLSRGAHAGDAEAMYMVGWMEASLVGTGDVDTSPSMLRTDSSGSSRPEELAIGWFVVASAYGSAPAWAALAERFRRGEYRDLETAVQYSRWCVSVAASQFHATGQQPHHEVLRLTPDTVDHVEKGHSGEEDELLQLQRLRAEQGDAVAQTAMGNLYYFGARGLPRDQPLARDFFQRAADQSHAPALSALAGMLLKGEGGEKETERAIALYEDAAEKGNVAALNGLGFMYFHGSEVPQNRTKALELFLRAGDAGSSGDAFFNAGKCFEEGHGTNQSFVRARELYEAAAFGAGHFDAIVDLGRFHAEGLSGPRNLQEACNFWEAAMKQGRWGGLPRAAFDRYRARDYDGAALLYAEAWQIGGEVPAANAAYLLDRGLASWDAWVGADWSRRKREPTAGSAPTLPKAVEGLRVVAKEEADVSERHRFILARLLYEYSLGHGGTSSALPLADILLFGKTGQPSDVTRAVELYAQASAQGQPQAAFTLGYLFEVGAGPLQQNEARALRYYQRSLELVHAKKQGHAFPIYWAMARIHFRAWWWSGQQRKQASACCSHEDSVSSSVSAATEELERGTASRWLRWSVDARGQDEARGGGEEDDDEAVYLTAHENGEEMDRGSATRTYRGEATRWQWVLADWCHNVVGIDEQWIGIGAVLIGIGMLLIVRQCWRARRPPARE